MHSNRKDCDSCYFKGYGYQCLNWGAEESPDADKSGKFPLEMGAGLLLEKKTFEVAGEKEIRCGHFYV